jgi:hypothetical protein
MHHRVIHYSGYFDRCPSFLGEYAREACEEGSFGDWLGEAITWKSFGEVENGGEKEKEKRFLKRK